MEFRNLTPFAAMQYAMVDVNDVEKNAVVMKVGYQLLPADGGTYVVRVRDEDAVPLCLEDEFSGQLNLSSVLLESDLAPFKPACDVIINASAQTPGGQACTDLPVSVVIKDASGAVVFSKEVLVTGECFFQQNAVTQKWSLSEPQPFTSLPLRWESAFGGECRIEVHEQTSHSLPDKSKLTQQQRAQHPQAPYAPLAHAVDENNPLGIGFITPWYARAKQPERYPAPRIIDPKHPISADDFAALIAGDAEMAGPQFRPAGLGCIGRTWLPRRALAGSYDEEWLAKRHPYLPADFDFGYWNCAPDDQQIAYPKLPLSVTLQGLSSQGLLSFTLPDHVAFILLRMENGMLLPQGMHLDTLHIDVDHLDVTVCWRCLIATSAPVRVIEARYETEPARLPEKIYPMITPKTSPAVKAI
ncbi:DUF2169 family type VI secretion system accessory protein [Rahnella victoriana]|uniref:DUF2169 family type VI secretion system accessory protein n=1 Tax=Rahnella victoriana TaxID=1510570 RepID=UPI001E3817CD|nr:DUF2169 domain-containing protein [Rahnella victoriana]UHM93053.1 DUF2169 domain-containing protein [Rahnella victoriana]